MQKFYALLILSHIASINAMNNDELRRMLTPTTSNTSNSSTSNTSSTSNSNSSNTQNTDNAQSSSWSALAWNLSTWAARKTLSNVQPEALTQVAQNLSKLATTTMQVGAAFVATGCQELTKNLESANSGMERYQMYSDALAKAAKENDAAQLAKITELVRKDTILIETAKVLLLKSYPTQQASSTPQPEISIVEQKCEELRKKIGASSDSFERYDAYASALEKAAQEKDTEQVQAIMKMVQNDNALINSAKERLLKPYATQV
jgi:hypothetical protein